MSEVVHTGFLFAILLGVIISVLGFIFAGPMLRAMDNPLPDSIVYLKIYFLGIPFNLLFNFCASIFKGVGDPDRPFAYLFISGLVNVVLNFIFVILFDLGVAGVAISTVLSQILSVFLAMRYLIKSKEMYHFDIKKVKFYPHEIKEIFVIGIPAGLQSVAFSLSGVLIQSNVNAFGSAVINGNSAGESLENIVNVAVGVPCAAALSFAGQSRGAQKYKNISKIMRSALALSLGFSVIFGGGFYLLKKPLVNIHLNNSSDTSLEIAYIRMFYLTLLIFISSLYDVSANVINGMGHHTLTTIVSLITICGVRIIWLLFVFRPNAAFDNIQNLHLLYACYPVTWILSFLILIVFYFIYRHDFYTRIPRINNNDVKAE